MRSLYIEFQEHSQDFLRLLGEKNRQAGRRKDAADELAVMEFFWDGVEAIFMKYERKIYELKMLSTVEHVQAVILRNELRDTYNEMFKVRDKIPDTVINLLSKTSLPSKSDLSEEVILKNKNGK